MKRLLVTGASGLLGLNLGCQLAGSYAVTGVTNRNSLSGAPFEVLSYDLSQPGQAERLLELTRPDLLVHCAAIANIDQAEAEPQVAEQVNARLPAELAAAAARRGVRMAHISTDAVFDGSKGQYTEEDAPNPLSVYARTKQLSEQWVAQANPQAIIARVNFYGWSLSGTRSLSEFFFNNLSAGKTVNGFTDVYFCPLLVNELVDQLMRLLEGGHSGLFHVVSREALSKYAFGVLLARTFGLDESLIRPQSVADSGLLARRSPLLTLNVDKLTRALGAPPPGQAEQMLRYYQMFQQGIPQRLQSYRIL